MSPANPFAGEMPFPIPGEGDFIFKLTSTEIMQLHGMFGPDTRKPPDLDPVTQKAVANHFWTTMIGHIEMHDPKVCLYTLKAGLKERGPDGKLVRIDRSEEWWDDPPFSFADISDALLNGVMWSRWGLTPDALAQQMREQAAAMEREAAEGGQASNPPQGTTESPTSSGSSSGPGKKGSRRQRRGR